jgi:hypothetical protein
LKSTFKVQNDLFKNKNNDIFDLMPHLNSLKTSSEPLKFIKKEPKEFKPQIQKIQKACKTVQELIKNQIHFQLHSLMLSSSETSQLSIQMQIISDTSDQILDSIK